MCRQSPKNNQFVWLQKNFKTLKMEIILTKMFQISTIFDEQILYILLQNVRLSDKNVSQLKNHKKSKFLEDQELFYQEVAP